MKKKFLAFIVFILFLSAISYNLEKTLAKTDYTEIIRQKDREIAMLKAELAEKDKEANKLKAFCQQFGIYKGQKVLPEPSVKIIEKPFYGVRLGEDINQLAKRVPVEFMQDFGFSKGYRVKNISHGAYGVYEVTLTVINDKVATISAYPADMSLTNCNAIIEGIKTEYPDVKQEPTTVDIKYNFNAVIDQQKVGIVVIHKQQSELDVLLTVSYVHPELIN
jgi:hypothetical protein